MSDGPKMRRPNVDYSGGGRPYGKTESDNQRYNKKRSDELVDRLIRGHETCADASRSVQRFYYHMAQKHLVCRQPVKDALRDAESFAQKNLCDSAKKAIRKARELAIDKKECGPGPKANEAIEIKMKSQKLMGLRRSRRHRRSPRSR